MASNRIGRINDVEIKDGTVYVTQTNGKTIQLRDDFVTYCTPVGDYGPYKVPEDSYFMMGDKIGRASCRERV